MRGLRFVKMHGIGNDYVYVDAFAQRVDDPAGLAVRIADRRFGVGGDGLILILPPDPGSGAHVRMRMFNADGSESEMCGNGIRCVCKYAHDHGLSSANPMRVETGAGVLELAYECDESGRVAMVTVDMGPPRLDPALLPARLPGAERGPIVDRPLAGLVALGEDDGWTAACGLDPRMTCVSMGNPHAVLFCRDVAAVPLERVGPVIENAPIFPRRVNVHFVTVRDRAELTMRTWERGSGVTLACGTGASAVCVAAVLTGRCDRAVTAHLPGGDLLLRWDEATGHVFMAGPAVEVFEGVVTGL
jgi:diaminopimelate epimerase